MTRIGLTLALCFVLTGCSTTSAMPLTPSPGKQDMANIQFDEAFYKNPGLAIAPTPVEIGISNIERGAVFQWYAYLHNGDGIKVKLLQITTEPKETVATIPIRVPLAENKLSDLVKIESPLLGENLIAVEYLPDTNAATIKGFIPEATRIIRIFYRTTSTYDMSYFITSKAKAGFVFMPDTFKEYVSFDTPVVTLAPFETKKILIKCMIPPGTKFPASNLEFGIAAHETATSGAQMQMTVGICQQVLVNLN